jgi:high-affinity iron transporter
MLAAAIVVFREVLEAALIVSVILAATQGVKGRLAMIAGGIGAGVFGAVVTALLTGAIANAFEGIGQELFQAGVLFTVVALLAWHIVWMQKHGRELVAEMKTVGAAVRAGTRPLIVLGIVVALAVLREGAEIVLFLQGMMSGGDPAQVAAGFGAGLIGGAAVGAVLYFGFLRLPIGLLFKATNGLLMLIAAGMAAKGAGKLIQAGVIPSLQDTVWDTSHVLPDDSMMGEFLSALVGYVAQPSGMQLVFYGATLLGVTALLLMQRRARLRAVAAE